MRLKAEYGAPVLCFSPLPQRLKTLKLTAVMDVGLIGEFNGNKSELQKKSHHTFPMQR
jgi:hypothetical protein